MATYSSICLGNSMHGEARWGTVHGVTNSRTQLKRLSTDTLDRWISPGRAIYLNVTVTYYDRDFKEFSRNTVCYISILIITYPASLVAQG